jgi:membrane protein DedA with SNARE-associated domain
MEIIHDTVYNLLFVLGPGLREVFIFLLGYLEGLPVIGSFVPGGTIAILIGSLSVEGYVNQILAVNLIVWAIFGIYVGSFLAEFLGENAIPVIIFTVIGILITTWIFNKFQKIRKMRNIQK